METIVTPVTVVPIDSTRIIHNAKADFVAIHFPPVVRLVQYDKSLPVIAVELLVNGQPYALPTGAGCNIRVHKPDATYVYNGAIGCDSTRTIVYFEVTQNMAAANGDGLAIVELVVNGDIAGTSLLNLHFEENPVPEDAIESSDEWETIYELGQRIIASTVTPVSNAADMTDTDRVYLYTGTETGWNQGHIYYYNGTTWVDAGIAVTDKTLTVEGMAADAKATGDEISSLKEDITSILDSAYVTDTASGSIASFPDGADNVPVKSLTVNIEPVQSGSGDPSPDNVRPISGHTQAVVTRTGKNLLFTNNTTVTLSGVTASKNSDGSWTLNGTCTEDDDLVLMSGSSIILTSGDFVLSGCPNGGGNTTYVLRARVVNSDGRVYPNDSGSGKSFETTIGSYIDRVYIEIKNGYTYNDLTFYPMVRPVTDTDATFAPYNGQTVTIDLDGTRYGGTLDVGTGVLTVNRGYALINGDVYGLAHNGSFPNNNVEIYVRLPKKNGITNLITNRFPIVANEHDTAWICHGASTSNRVNFTMPPEIATKQDAVNWFTSNPTEIVYELETPVTVQLTPQEVTTLLGKNNIWNDCGDTEVEYRADTKLYIQKVLNA